MPLDLSFPVYPRRSIIFGMLQHKGMLRSRHHNTTDDIIIIDFKNNSLSEIVSSMFIESLS